MASFFPRVGSWHQDLSTAMIFEVISVDEKTGNIEVQYADGDISDFDIKSWGQMTLTAAEAAPVVPSPDYDISILDSEFENEQFYTSGHYSNPLEGIEPDTYIGFDDPF